VNIQTARAIRARGDWGEQGGLLSVAEMCLLNMLVYSQRRVLEVGHYCGLSTACLAHTEELEEDHWRIVVTVDSHAGDQWVPQPAGVERFLKNHGNDWTVCPLFISSQAIVAPIAFPCVFYDGDHGAEQLRFTNEVIKSPMVKLFIFDDRDFPVPRECEQALRDAGWKDESPPLYRGPNDKRDEETMTMGVWRRP
jgi:hypothetical protein